MQSAWNINGVSRMSRAEAGSCRAVPYPPDLNPDRYRRFADTEPHRSSSGPGGVVADYRRALVGELGAAEPCFFAFNRTLFTARRP
jgi:hypothetical protein